MSEILIGMPDVVNLIDDILIFDSTKAENDQRLEKTWQKLEKEGVTLKKAKCCIGVAEVAFLGCLISKEGIKPDPKKVEALKTLEAPRDASGVRRLLGMANHLARFIPNLSQISAPLRELLQKGHDWTWAKPQEDTLNNIKKLISSDRCMAKYGPNASQ